MLSHLHNVRDWLSVYLGVSSPKAHLSPAEEQEAMAKAMKLLNLIKAHKFAEALENGSPTSKHLMSAATLEGAFNHLQKVKGPLVSFEPVGVEAFESETVANILVKFEKEELLAVITTDTNGLLDALRFKLTKDVPPVCKHPSYAHPNIFIEEHIMLGANDVELEAIISFPMDGKPVAGVIFLGDSGPTDKDSTLGPNKPLKDLAWGLATNNIAVCRWDKPGAEKSSKLSSEDITLSKEYLPYASAVVEAVRKRLDATGDAAPIPIFVVGHGLGAIIAPMLATSVPSIKGLVLLSAGGGKIYDSALRQINYLVSIEHDPPFATQEFATALETQVETIKSPEFSPNTSTEELPFGAPASYWLSVKEYDQVATAAKLDIPIAILQPGRDYQVTVEDDLEKWKVGLEKGGKKDVTFKIYEGLNHLLIADGGEGQATPDAYAKEGYVDESVVEDICAWIKAHLIASF